MPSTGSSTRRAPPPPSSLTWRSSGVTGQDRYWERAQRRARRVVARLVRDPEHGAWVFAPGRLDPYNCSNNVIDSGECARCLGTLLLHADDMLDAALRELVVEALRRNATTYLTDAAATKEVTNQRLWGAMGLATAARALGEPPGLRPSA